MALGQPDQKPEASPRPTATKPINPYLQLDVASSRGALVPSDAAILNPDTSFIAQSSSPANNAPAPINLRTFDPAAANPTANPTQTAQAQPATASTNSAPIAAPQPIAQAPAVKSVPTGQPVTATQPVTGFLDSTFRGLEELAGIAPQAKPVNAPAPITNVGAAPKPDVSVVQANTSAGAQRTPPPKPPGPMLPSAQTGNNAPSLNNAPAPGLHNAAKGQTYTEFSRNGEGGVTERVVQIGGPVLHHNKEFAPGTGKPDQRQAFNARPNRRSLSLEHSSTEPKPSGGPIKEAQLNSGTPSARAAVAPKQSLMPSLG